MLQLPTYEKSLWQESYAGPTYPTLHSNIHVDVAVIGAGITGLSTAYLLKKAGKTVAVLDKSTIGGGTTGRTTGKVTSQHNLVYNDLADRVGTEVAQMYAGANQSAVALVKSIVEKEKISCGLDDRDSYVYTLNPKNEDVFRNEVQAATNFGLPASLVTTTPLPFNVAAAIKFSNQSTINSQKYLVGLARAVDGDGSYVYENSTVIWIDGGKTCHVRTSKAKVSTDQVIVATNVPTFPLLARGTYCLFEYPVESYIVAGITEKPLDGMYISPDKYNYSILPFNTFGVQHVLIGGEGHFSALRYNRDKKYQKLANFAEQRLGVTEITHKWSDRDYIPYDGVPLVGTLYPWSKNIYVATGMKKWGLSNGTAAAMILRDQILKRDNPWASIYYPHRFSLIKSIPSAVQYNIRNL